MRRALPASLVLAALVFVGCSDRETRSPTEPDFGKKPPASCLTEAQQDLSTSIRGDIETFFADFHTKDAAEGQINNIERKLCKEQYDDSWNMAWGFLGFTKDKIPDKFLGDASDAAALTSDVFELAADPEASGDPPLIPGGAFLPTGGVVSFDPADATPENPIVAATQNGEAAVVVDGPNVFPPGTGTVTIVFSRAPDEEVGGPGEFIPGFQAYPEGYRIVSSHQPSPTGGGVIIALCVLDGAPADVVIGHLHDSSVELLVPTDPDPEYLGYIDCTSATNTDGIDLVTVPTWLRLARQLVQPVVRLFEPKPLNAMFFGGRGLGGRTTSLSLDAAVDPTIEVGESVQLSVGTDAVWMSDDVSVATVDGSGLVTCVNPDTANITAEFGDESLSMVVTCKSPGLVVPGTSSLLVTVMANAESGDPSHPSTVTDTDSDSQSGTIEPLSVSVSAQSAVGGGSLYVESDATVTWSSVDSGEMIWSMGWTADAVPGTDGSLVSVLGCCTSEGWHYSFTAEESGLFTMDYEITASGTSVFELFGLSPYQLTWNTSGSPQITESMSPATPTGSFDFDVEAGRTYTIRIQNASGLGSAANIPSGEWNMTGTFTWSINYPEPPV
jgi:hypothetical protein